MHDIISLIILEFFLFDELLLIFLIKVILIWLRIILLIITTQSVHRWQPISGILDKILEHLKILLLDGSKNRWLVSVEPNEWIESKVTHENVHKLLSSIFFIYTAEVCRPVEYGAKCLLFWGEIFLFLVREHTNVESWIFLALLVFGFSLNLIVLEYVIKNLSILFKEL